MSLNENEYRGTHGNLRLGRVRKTKQGQRSSNQESPGFSRGECQEQYNRLMAMKAYLEDPAPLPMRDDEDTDLRASYPADPEPAEDENWTK